MFCANIRANISGQGIILRVTGPTTQNNEKKKTGKS